MATIEIRGNALCTPDGRVIENCWEDRQGGLLSREACLAIMPYENENNREIKRTDTLLHDYTVDGEAAFVGYVVVREEGIVFMNDGERTGRITLTTLSEIQDLLGGR